MRLLSLENRTPLQKLLMLSALTPGGSVDVPEEDVPDNTEEGSEPDD